MAWTKTSFGTMENGAEVFRYTLTNDNGVSAAFTDLGLSLIHIQMCIRDRGKVKLMKKLAYILLAGVLVLGTLSGCGTKDVKEETQISSAAESTAEEEMKQETAETETKAGAEGSDCLLYTSRCV